MRRRRAEAQRDNERPDTRPTRAARGHRRFRQASGRHVRWVWSQDRERVWVSDKARVQAGVTQWVPRHLVVSRVVQEQQEHLRGVPRVRAGATLEDQRLRQATL